MRIASGKLFKKSF